MRGVKAVDIQRGVGFSVTETLCVCQHVGKPEFFPFHAGEDIIAGTVQDPVHAFDPVAHKGFPQALDDGNTAGNAGFVPEVRAVLFRSLKEFRSELGEQGLVGGHNALAHVQGFQNKLFGDGGAADQFHHNIAAFHQFRNAGGEDPFRHGNAAVCGNIQVRDLVQFHFHARATGNDFFILEQAGRHTGADRTESNDTDFQFFHSLFSLKFKKICVIRI